MASQQAEGWAICHDCAGVMINTVASTRRGAIDKFMAFTGDLNTSAEWRRFKRKGWRASHVSIRELRFTPEAI